MPLIAMHGKVALSAERVAGVTSMNTTESSTTTLSSSGSTSRTTLKNEAEETATRVNLLWNGGASNVFAIPRLAIDGFVAPQVTIGGSAGYLSGSGTSKTTSTATSSGASVSISNSDDLPDASAFVVSPRLGVVIALGPGAALWLRGGITYYQTSVESTTTSPPTSSGGSTITRKITAEASGTAATFDAQIVFVPVDHVGITVGPVFDIGLGGSTKTTTLTSTSGTSTTQTVVTEGDITQSNYGGAAGIVAFF
jgi:hypothetical protein